jgi:UMF1 family MFS transporter
VIAMIVVFLISPILGAIADFSASKKRFLFLFSSIAWLFTGLLFFVQEGDIFIGMLFFILAEIGYRSGQVFYNSLLPEIAEPEDMGRVSGNAWAIGSLGGIICLLILLPLITSFEGTFIVRLSFVFTAFFFAVSCLPTFLWIREKAVAKVVPQGETYFSAGIKQIKKTIESFINFEDKDFSLFILAFFIYNDGILMALDFAAIIGAVLFGMGQQQLIIFMIAVQVTSVLGAYIAGIVGDRIGFKRSLIYSLIMMIAVVLGMLFAQNITHFYIIGALAGFALTGVQSVSRALISYFAPEGQSAEFYGIFAIAGRTSSFIGPWVYGRLAVITTIVLMNRGYIELLAEQIGQRVAIGSIAVFLLAGLLILLGVNDPTKKYIRS